jgi:hypothetical protein
MITRAKAAGLRRGSQEDNVKLREVARRVCEEGSLDCTGQSR